MPVIVATFGKPEDITNPGTDGKVFRFPAELIDRNDMVHPVSLRRPNRFGSELRFQTAASKCGASDSPTT